MTSPPTEPLSAAEREELRQAAEEFNYRTGTELTPGEAVAYLKARDKYRIASEPSVVLRLIQERDQAQALIEELVQYAGPTGFPAERIDATIAAAQRWLGVPVVDPWAEDREGEGT